MANKIMTSIDDSFKLLNTRTIPCLGFGTYLATRGKNPDVIGQAIRAGYRHIDTASLYGTEPEVGEAIQKSRIPREEFFLTSKVYKTDMGYEKTKEAFQRSLDKLQTTYLDMYMIHWPLPYVNYTDWRKLNLDTWRAMEELYFDGKIRVLGVCNCMPHHLLNIMENSIVMPAVDQLELHPGYMQEEAVEFCRKHGIVVEGWSPTGRGVLLENEFLKGLALKYEVSVAQICLRFLLQSNILPLIKTSSMERMKENQDVFGFNISEEDMEAIRNMPLAGWSGEHPDRLRVAAVD
ncbi:aldo/keto reductase [Lacrimispora sp. NSJ-141]|uniref:Aldo/keto reductase n=1 Tax=Lientehia hominis TaxID=2897778 RepID=A0AAP2RJZ8_9FIRM|nr:aldo/keto reductase [Lientehia hominis]MCD2493417.1 aldo/keto reductase [Lientehia hominis]